MANEVVKITDQNGVDHPIKDLAAFPRSEQAVLGAKNLLPNNGKTETISDVVFTVNSDKSITANGTASANIAGYHIIDHLVLKAGVYIVTGGISQNNSVFLRIGNNDSGDAGLAFVQNEPAVLTLQNDTDINVRIHISSGQVMSNVVFKPMIRLATDTDPTYAPYAMTNRELTEKVQGIIDAATNAADFAAFKTAIGNL